MYWGKLASVDLNGCNHEVIQNKEKIKEFIGKLCRVIDMKPVGEPVIKKFGEDSLEGFSAFQFIETSSITIHLDDKIADRAFIDIFSCKDFDAKKAKKFSQEFFKAQKSKMKVIIRK